MMQSIFNLREMPMRVLSASNNKALTRRKFKKNKLNKSSSKLNKNKTTKLNKSRSSNKESKQRKIKCWRNTKNRAVKKSRDLKWRSRQLS